jgi:hypothetical protein
MPFAAEIGDCWLISLPYASSWQDQYAGSLHCAPTVARPSASVLVHAI